MGLESMFGRREKWKDGDEWGIAGRILELMNVWQERKVEEMNWAGDFNTKHDKIKVMELGMLKIWKHVM